MHLKDQLTRAYTTHVLHRSSIQASNGPTAFSIHCDTLPIQKNSFSRSIPRTSNKCCAQDSGTTSCAYVCRGDETEVPRGLVRWTCWKRSRGWWNSWLGQPRGSRLAERLLAIKAVRASYALTSLKAARILVGPGGCWRHGVEKGFVR